MHHSQCRLHAYKRLHFAWSSDTLSLTSLATKYSISHLPCSVNGYFLGGDVSIFQLCNALLYACYCPFWSNCILVDRKTNRQRSGFKLCFGGILTAEVATAGAPCIAHLLSTTTEVSDLILIPKYSCDVHHGDPK